MASVTLRNVSKFYPETGVWAVKDVSLDVHDKEFIVLVGPSGCGKSTILRIIAGLEDVTEGEVYIDGVKVNDVHPKDRDIAMVFQNYALYPHMTVYKNMAFSLKMRGYSKSEISRRVKEAAELLGITHLLDRKPKVLSGGERQRTALGRAIVRNPKTFLFDEPLSNLDAKLRVQMRTELSKLHQRLQTTMIYVTHDQVEALTMGSRIVVLNQGVIQQVDTPIQLYERPKNFFVATFIGTPPINTFEAQLVKREDGFFLEKGEFSLAIGSALPEVLYPYIGREILVGIRPDHLCLVHDGIEAKIDLIEPLGSKTHLFVKCKGLSFVLVVDTHERVRVGDVVRIRLDPHRLHLFCPETKALICSNF